MSAQEDVSRASFVGTLSPLSSAVANLPSSGVVTKPPSQLSRLVRILYSPNPGPIEAHDATAAVAQATSLLLRAHATSTTDLLIALSATASLAASDSSSASSTRATQEMRPASGLGPLHCEDGWRSLAPRPPAVLPLLPLLASVASRDQAGTEAALRRLNPRLAYPLSWATDAGHGGGETRQASGQVDSEGGGSSNASSGGLPASASGSGGGCPGARWAPPEGCLGARGPDGGGAHLCRSSQSAASAAVTSSFLSSSDWSRSSSASGVSSLHAARQAEAQVLSEQEGCKAAAARLCGRGTQLHSQRSGGPTLSLAAASDAAEAEVEAIRSACVSALAAAAADVRCHQVLLGSGALDALPQLLRGPATAGYAAVLVHNLAAPPSASFRDQLRRRGVILPLFHYAARLTAPNTPSTPGGGGPRRAGPLSPPFPAAGSDQSSLAIALTALVCLSAGQEGGEALRQPELRAHRRLLALQERLAAWRGDSSQCGSSGGGSSASQAGAPVATPAHGWQGGGAVAAGGGGGRAEATPGGFQGGRSDATSLNKLEALVRRLLRVVGGPMEREPATTGASSGYGTPPSQQRRPPRGAGGCGPDLRVAGAVGVAPAATPGTATPHQQQQQHQEPTVEEGDGTRIAFQSQVLVDGRPLQLTSFVTRTSARRPDGSLDVQYHFQDQVSPGPAAAGLAQGPARSPLLPAGPCYRSSSTWLHTGIPPAGQSPAPAPPLLSPWPSPSPYLEEGGGGFHAAADPDHRQRDQAPDTAAVSGAKALLHGARYNSSSGGTTSTSGPQLPVSPHPNLQNHHAAAAQCTTPGMASKSGTPPLLFSPPPHSPLGLLAEHAGRFLSRVSDQRRRSSGPRRPDAT